MLIRYKTIPVFFCDAFAMTLGVPSAQGEDEFEVARWKHDVYSGSRAVRPFTSVITQSLSQTQIHGCSPSPTFMQEKEEMAEPTNSCIDCDKELDSHSAPITEHAISEIPDTGLISTSAYNPLEVSTFEPPTALPAPSVTIEFCNKVRLLST